eukprot:524729-Hanusia_phi.AAC.1
MMIPPGSSEAAGQSDVPCHDLRGRRCADSAASGQPSWHHGMVIPEVQFARKGLLGPSMGSAAGPAGTRRPAARRGGSLAAAA